VRLDLVELVLYALQLLLLDRELGLPDGSGCGLPAEALQLLLLGGELDGLSLDFRRLPFHLLVLFEEFIEEHGVDRFVAHGVGRAVLIAHHEVGIDPGHVLGDQSELFRFLRFLYLSGRTSSRNEERFNRTCSTRVAWSG
jgi:hypothetical protein